MQPPAILTYEIPPASPTETRSLGLDLARLFAAISICWLHTWESQLRPLPGDLGRFAVPFFVTSAVCLMCRTSRASSRPFQSYVWDRFRRIYLPFVGWSVIYLIATDLKHHFITHEPPYPIGFSTLFGNAAAHLWFLPFLFLVNVIFYLPSRFLFQHRNSLPITGLASLAIGLALTQLPYPGRTNTYFLDFSSYCASSIFFGISLAALMQFVPITRIAWLALIIVPICMIRVYLTGRNLLLENLSGLALAIAAFAPLQAPWARPFARLGFLAYGIYLSHYLIPEAVRAFTVKRHIPPLTPYILFDFALVVLGSIAISLFLYRFKPTRWLVGI